MIQVNVNFGKLKDYYFIAQKQNADFEGQLSGGVNCRELVTTWKYDEEGNIVYYTYDKKTGEIISKTKYKNPYQNLIQPK